MQFIHLTKLQKVLASLKIKHSLSKETLITLYYSLIYPYLIYCLLVWGSASPTTLEKIFILQKRVLRLITLSNYNEHTLPLFKAAMILPFNELYKYLCSIFLFKYLKCEYPESFRSIFNPFSVRVQSCTRLASVGHYVLPYSRTKLRQNFLLSHAVKLYNEFILPLNLIEHSYSLNSFKRSLKNILL